MTYTFPPVPYLPVTQDLPAQEPPVPQPLRQRVIAWYVIVVSATVIFWGNWRLSKIESASTASAESVQLNTELMCRYIVGIHSLKAGRADTTGSALLGQLDGNASSPADKLAAVTIAAEVQGKEAALRRLDQLAPALAPPLAADSAALRAIYSGSGSALSLQQRADLADHLGWCGKLALTFGQDGGSAQRKAVLSDGRRTAAVLATGTVAAIGFGILGFVLLVILMVRLADKTLRRNFRPEKSAANASLEAFAIYIGGIAAASIAPFWMPARLSHNLPFHVGLMFIPTLVAIAWPLLRGVGREAWRNALGWHGGRGVVLEAGLGIVGYVAGLPIIAAGMIATLVLAGLAHAKPSHPIQHMLGGSRLQTLLVLLMASGYAPLTEETFFRGAFFNALRSRHAWIVSALATSFLFALIHPQGWTAVPALMSIAIVLAAIREWRATIISSAMAHCLHNTILVAVITFALG